ncbi:MAG: PIN domain-containing protein [Rubrobacteraceae bacterium]|nr:PIN domain-containing protein [Rubrobacteraceae bacterium]
MITLDTSGLFALLNRTDNDHQRVKAALFEDRGPYLVPAGILAEIAYMVEERLGARVLESLLLDLESGGLTLECGEEDLPRIRELVGRYADLPLGYADASVVSCAERNGGRVLTLDLRHFGVVAAEGRITLLP